jgi:hypothetical protein
LFPEFEWEGVGVRSSPRIAGWALLVFAVSFVGNFLLEGVRESLGFPDADNPVVMMRFLNERVDIFTYSGLLFVLMGLSLVVAVLVIWDGEEQDGRSLLFRFSSILGLFAAAFLFANGVLRVQAPGALIHMGNMDSAFGEAGYLSVQIVGTQGLGSAGGFAVAIWVVTLSVHNFKTHRFWPALSWIGLAAVAMLAGAFIGPLLPDSGLVYTAYILGIAVTMIWTLLLGLNILTTKRSDPTRSTPT